MISLQGYVIPEQYFSYYDSINMTVPSIPTLDRICKGFGISLSAFFEYDKNPIRIESLSDTEQDIINSYRVLSAKDKELLTAYLDGLCKR